MADGTSSSTAFYTLHYDFKLFRPKGGPPSVATPDVHAFTHTALPSRVLFGVDTLSRISEELANLGVERALVSVRGIGGPKARPS